MATYDFDIGVIGGGSAGLTVAAGAAQAGAKVLLIEKDERLGGDCLHYGCVPSKTLIRTAQVYHLMKKAQEFGLPGTNLPPPHYPDITKRIESVIDTIQRYDSEERFCSLGVRVEHGCPVFTDEHSIEMDGRRHSAKNWVIATGSTAAVPPLEGLTESGSITNKEIYFLNRLPESMIIIGGGPLGIEFAQSFARLGTKVTVIEFLPQILSNDDRDLTDVIMEALKSEGVKFYLGSSITAVRSADTQKEVTFRKGDGTKTVRAEVLLVAAGRKANLEGLGFEAIGVERDKRGLKLDGRLRTTQPHIYGAGDVTGSYQFTHAAGYEGGIVVSNAIFHLPRKADYRLMPWVTYTDPELASIGMNEKSAANAGIKVSVRSEEFVSNDRSLAEGEATGRIKMLLNEKERPVGVQVLGHQAGELLAEWVSVLNGGVRLSTLASAVHPYPTLGEINKRVAGNFLATKIFSEKVKKVLKLFFSLKGRACGEMNRLPAR